MGNEDEEDSLQIQTTVSPSGLSDKMNQAGSTVESCKDLGKTNPEH